MKPPLELQDSISIRTQDLTISLRDKHVRRGIRRERVPGMRVLNEVSVDIPPATYVAIKGSTGSGKTTLLGAIIGLLPENQQLPSSGTVTWNNIDIYSLKERDREALRRRTGFVPQAFPPNRGMTLAEQVVINHKLNNLHVGKRAITGAFESVGLDKHPDSPALGLSGGETRKLALASAILNPNIEWLFCDEPAAGTDEKSNGEINALLDGINATGIGIILITHEETTASRAITLAEGQIVHDTNLQDDASIMPIRSRAI